jgi:hypothetical protein
MARKTHIVKILLKKRFLKNFSETLEHIKHKNNEYKLFNIKLNVFRTLKELQVEIDYIFNNLITIEKVKSITAYDFYIKQYQTIFN